MNSAIMDKLRELKEKALDGEFTPEKSRFVEYIDMLEDEVRRTNSDAVKALAA